MQKKKGFQGVNHWCPYKEINHMAEYTECDERKLLKYNFHSSLALFNDHHTVFVHIAWRRWEANDPGIICSGIKSSKQAMSATTMFQFNTSLLA